MIDYERWLTDTATYWPPGQPDGFGGTTAGPPELVMVRWEDKTVLIRNANGEEVGSSAVVFVDRPLAIDGHIVRGDETATSSPTNDAREIRQIYTTKSLDGSTRLNKVYL